MFYPIFLSILFLTSNLSAEPNEILGIGAPCMDILINVDDNFLQTLGVKGGSQQTDKEAFDLIIQRGQNQNSVTVPGGSCANTIKGLAKLNHQCAFFGKLANDSMGQKFTQNMHDHNIDFNCVYGKGSSTQLCACMIAKDGERTMRCYPGCANDITKDNLKPELFRGVKLVHVEGYMLKVHDPDFLKEALRMAKEMGCQVSMDLSSKELVQQHRQTMLNLLKKYVDIVFANADEVQALLHVGPRQGCRQLKEICKIAVVMLGKEGCLVGSKNAIFHVPRVNANVVDTTGAGDLFASGFLHGYLLKCSLKECGKWGNTLGASVCEVVGAEIPEKNWQYLRLKLNP